ncbi:hypothetical protein IHN32_00815 [Deinococcus sp. 14RED07]|uniref:hypothetical protein n=1 Tax=Deinococcus sp. 14RED07 TaxID=2745874 RepID=UPI001E5F79FF|nr:hypothetical protein [Deinococcus sp. 14RED07]MCD0174497.1 hypothetical protein [Deinococcus sp. 14RED07]
MKPLLTLTIALSALSLAPASALPSVNCTQSPTDARCVPVSMPAGAGTIGSGPTFYQGGYEQLRGGFVTPDGKSLIVAVETLRNTDPFGAVMSVDLNTGDRRVVSGYLNTVERVGNGVKVQGDRDQLDLYHLGDIFDVKPLPDGSLVANNGQVIRIDPATGNRTLLWTPVTSSDTRVRDSVEVKFADPRAATPAANLPAAPAIPNIKTPVGNLGGLLGGLLGGSAPAPAAAQASSGPNTSFGNGYFCRQNDAAAARPAVPIKYMHVDSAGSIYMFGNNNPLGAGFALFKLDAKNDYRCTSVSRFANNGENIQGSGIPWTSSEMGSGPLFGAFAANGTTLYASGGPNPNYVVVSVDTQTGERRLVSGQTHEGGAQAFKKGQGDAHIGSMLVYSGGSLYTTQEQVLDAPFSLVKIDPATGNRSVIQPMKGTPLERGQARNTMLYAVPGSTQLLVWFNGALHVLDPATGKNFILSR